MDIILITKNLSSNLFCRKRIHITKSYRWLIRSLFLFKSVLLINFIFLFQNTIAQDKTCKVKKMDDGSILVKYCISKIYDEFGNKFIQIEDSTTTVSHVDFNKCIALMKEVSKHKLFTGDAKSELLRVVSDNEWDIYYYTDNPWPIKNSDCVSRMSFTENKEEKIAFFKLVAKPLAYEKRNVSRMIHFNITYAFKDLGNGTVKITMTGKSSPPVKVPLWLIKSAFPSAPANAIRKFIAIIKE